jgi:hypothetical protein
LEVLHQNLEASNSLVNIHRQIHYCLYGNESGTKNSKICSKQYYKLVELKDYVTLKTKSNVAQQTIVSHLALTYNEKTLEH